MRLGSDSPEGLALGYSGRKEKDRNGSGRGWAKKRKTVGTFWMDVTVEKEVREKYKIQNSLCMQTR